MNHESLYTKRYVNTVNHYWLNEYRIDGLRFDLSKGFTQRNNPENVGAWSLYDASRIAILKRMADRIWEHTPDAYIILEHLSDNSEEKELAEYRSASDPGHDYRAMRGEIVRDNPTLPAWVRGDSLH